MLDSLTFGPGSSCDGPNLKSHLPSFRLTFLEGEELDFEGKVRPLTLFGLRLGWSLFLGLLCIDESRSMEHLLLSVSTLSIAKH